MADGRHFENI